MKKPIISTGKNGTFTGSIEVKLNYRKRTKMVHNRSLHEDMEVSYPVSIVIGDAMDKKFESEEFVNTNDVFKHIDIVTEKVQDHLQHLASKTDTLNIFEKLKAAGFQ